MAVATGVFSFLAIGGALMLFENSLIFFPSKDGVGRSPGEDVFLTTSDGVKIHAWYVSHPSASITLLWFHGNAGNLEDRREWLAGLRDLPANVLTIDYRGYGKSEGKPDELGVYRDAQAAYDWLVKRGKPEKLVIMGESLGGAVACDLASKVKCGGLIVQSSFTNAADMTPLVMPHFPARWFLRTKFDNLGKVARISVPKLILHASDDEVIPFAMGQKLCAAAAPPKECTWFQTGGHNGIYMLAGKEYYQRLAKFLKLVEQNITI